MATAADLGNHPTARFPAESRPTSWQWRSCGQVRLQARQAKQLQIELTATEYLNGKLLSIWRQAEPLRQPVIGQGQGLQTTTEAIEQDSLWTCASLTDEREIAACPAQGW